MPRSNINWGWNLRQLVVTIVLGCLIAPSLLRAEIRDAREEIKRESEENYAEHFLNGQVPPKHGWAGPQKVKPSLEEPGGTGYGYYFYDDSLIWTNSTIADYYVICPTSLGGNVDYLYLTSTCRAQLGTESLIAYAGENEAQFWIFDWAEVATNAANPWPVTFDLPSAHPQYLTQRYDEFATLRQMCHIRNGTFYLGLTNGLYQWKNQVQLFNFNRGDWDLIYSHVYTTTNYSDNVIKTGGSGLGFWGPIVETFPPYTNITTVGFDLIRLFQDQNPHPLWLGTSNSYGYQNDTTLPAWQLLTEAPNTSFTVALSSNQLPVGSYNMGTLCVTATTNVASFSLNPPTGIISPNWVIAPDGQHWDKTVVGLTPGSYTITFNPVQGLITPTNQSFTIASKSISTVMANYGSSAVFRAVRKNGNAVVFIWSGVSNYVYQLQYTTNLSQTSWIDLGDAITATNDTVTSSNILGPDPSRFYRVIGVP